MGPEKTQISQLWQQRNLAGEGALRGHRFYILASPLHLRMFLVNRAPGLERPK